MNPLIEHLDVATITFLAVTLFVLSLVGSVLVVHGTVKKNDWGICLSAPRCPKCSVPMPQIRAPRSFRQTMWGGGTCSQCDIEVDKWGRERS